MQRVTSSYCLSECVPETRINLLLTCGIKQACFTDHLVLFLPTCWWSRTTSATWSSFLLSCFAMKMSLNRLQHFTNTIHLVATYNIIEYINFQNIWRKSIHYRTLQSAQLTLSVFRPSARVRKMHLRDSYTGWGFIIASTDELLILNCNNCRSLESSAVQSLPTIC